MSVVQNELVGHTPQLSEASVTSVRVVYPDLHGVARGKDVPLVEPLAEQRGGRRVAVHQDERPHAATLGGSSPLRSAGSPSDFSSARTAATTSSNGGIAASRPR